MPKVINLISYHIAEDIERTIYETCLAPGEKIPSERDLAEHYHVTRVTLRNALQRLIDDGIIYNIPSSGYFVAHAKVKRDTSYYFFPNHDPCLKSIAYVKEEIDVLDTVTKLISIPFSIDDMDEMKINAYIEKIDELPISLTYTLQNKKSYDRYPLLFEGEKPQNLTQRQKIRVYHANDNEMQILKVSSNDSLFLISEFINDESELIAVCESICVGTRCEIKLDIKTKE